MSVEYLGNGAPDGSCFGSSATEKIAFFGATPVVQQSATVTTVATTNSISTTTTKWGFSTSTQANQIIVAVDEMLQALANLGVIA